MLNEEFTTKDSGQRRTFETGSVRDIDTSKPRPDLIPDLALWRLAGLYARGAQKYDPRNWEKGQPVSVLMASLQRHLLQYKMGHRDEDHLAAVAWGILAIMHFEEKAKQGDKNALKMLDEYASKMLADQIKEEFDEDKAEVDTTDGTGEFAGWGSARVIGVDWAKGEDQTVVAIQPNTP